MMVYLKMGWLIVIVIGLMKRIYDGLFKNGLVDSAFSFRSDEE